VLTVSQFRALEPHEQDDDLLSTDCLRCAGEGFIEYLEAGPDVWGEDCPSEENHLVTCPDCGGTGRDYE